jgi:hypothetical protein
MTKNESLRLGESFVKTECLRKTFSRQPLDSVPICFLCCYRQGVPVPVHRTPVHRYDLQHWRSWLFLQVNDSAVSLRRRSYIWVRYCSFIHRLQNRRKWGEERGEGCHPSGLLWLADCHLIKDPNWFLWTVFWIHIRIQTLDPDPYQKLRIRNTALG